MFLLRPITIDCERWIERHIEYEEKINGDMALDLFLLVGVLNRLCESGFGPNDDFEILQKYDQ